MRTKTLAWNTMAESGTGVPGWWVYASLALTASGKLLDGGEELLFLTTLLTHVWKSIREQASDSSGRRRRRKGNEVTDLIFNLVISGESLWAGPINTSSFPLRHKLQSETQARLRRTQIIRCYRRQLVTHLSEKCSANLRCLLENHH